MSRILICLCVALAGVVGCVVWLNREPRTVPHNVELNWNASVSPNVVGYNVYRAENRSGPYKRLNSTPVRGTRYTDFTVVSGRVYFYVVRALDQFNVESADSTETIAIIPSP